MNFCFLRVSLKRSLFVSVESEHILTYLDIFEKISMYFYSLIIRYSRKSLHVQKRSKIRETIHDGGAHFQDCYMSLCCKFIVTHFWPFFPETFKYWLVSSARVASNPWNPWKPWKTVKRLIPLKRSLKYPENWDGP